MQIKIMNYNILYGFHSYPRMDRPPLFQKKRLDAAKRVVEKENPDILLLLEASFGGPNHMGINLDYPKLFGYTHYFWGRLSWEWGQCVLSRFPIESGIELGYGNKKALFVVIRTKKKKVPILIIHPAPVWPSEEKLRATRELFDSNKTILRTKSLIVAGDFNECSDEDHYDRDSMIKGFRKLIVQEGWKATAKDVADSQLNPKIAPFLKSKGIYDTYNKNNGPGITIPTEHVGHKDEPPRRIDFIFATKDFNPLDSYIVKNKYTEVASDHRPVVAILEFK